MNHNLTTPARLNNGRSDPSASTIRKTSIVEWHQGFETPMFESIKSPHQIANELRKSEYSFDTPPSFIRQSRASIRNPNESFEIDACEVSMLLSEDFSDIDKAACITPKTKRLTEVDTVSSNECSTQMSFKRSRDIALESLDCLVSTSPCKSSHSSSLSTPRMSLSRFLKSQKSRNKLQRSAFSREDFLSGNELEKGESIKIGISAIDNVQNSVESIDSASDTVLQELEVRTNFETIEDVHSEYNYINSQREITFGEMMSQIEHSNEKIFESDENQHHRIEQDSQDFYCSKNEFTQSVLCQVDQMSQYLKKYENDQEIFNNTRHDSCSISVTKEEQKRISYHRDQEPDNSRFKFNIKAQQVSSASKPLE